MYRVRKFVYARILKDKGNVIEGAVFERSGDGPPDADEYTEELPKFLYVQKGDVAVPELVGFAVPEIDFAGLSSLRNEGETVWILLTEKGVSMPNCLEESERVRLAKLAVQFGEPPTRDVLVAFSGAEEIDFNMEGENGDVPVLRAQLYDVDGNLVDADINLDERVANDNGNLIFV
ncbi:small acidic protein family domain-containing protein [Purpureocillium lavendulum]|uniref:Small acidic protein family domain-containing protein n=1 Tax=Purpureocillium lavendulum TaxID=1247861 RepID=A0AB34FGB1_9HYPO|nr:small acidic protein family domain-containing protein [Purpureocillium lavendulum]